MCCVSFWPRRNWMRSVSSATRLRRVRRHLRLDGQHPPEEIEARRARVADLADELVSQRAEARIGEMVQVLVEEADGEIIGRAAHQGPEVDGNVRLITRDRFKPR